MSESSEPDPIEEITKAAVKWQGLRNSLNATDLRVREAVVSIHLGLEHLLDLVICTRFLEPEEDKPGRYEDLTLLLSKIDFAKKTRLAAELGLLPSNTSSRLFAVNDMRVAFAHGYPRRHPNLNYKGRPIFDCFPIFAEDMQRLGSELMSVVQSVMPEDL
jgi:hypothetical protein